MIRIVVGMFIVAASAGGYELGTASITESSLLLVIGSMIFGWGLLSLIKSKK